MEKLYIVYTETDVRIAGEENAFHCLANGWNLYAVTDKADHAELRELELA